MSTEKMTEEILKLLGDSLQPLQLKDISAHFGYKSDTGKYFVLKELLNQLCDDNLLRKSSRRRYSLIDYSSESALQGVFVIRKDRAIVITDNPEYQKINIRRKYFGTALDGDIVVVQLHAVKPGRKPKGEITGVVDRADNIIVGELEIDDNFCFLIPDDEKYYVDFLIPKDKLNGAEDGDKVSARFLRWIDPLKSPRAEVVEILGKAGEPEAEFDSIIEEFKLPKDFPPEVKTIAKKLKIDISEKELSRRHDIRDMEIITIDPADARDFDDALSLEILPNGDNYLGVHIADVSHFVQENSDLDIDARTRGNSVYLVDRVVPMLPEELSNELCSLKPNVDRFAFSVFMTFGPRGGLKDYKIEETVINSKRRYSYEEVQEILESGQGDKVKLLEKLNNLAKTLKKKRFLYGGVNFHTSEVKYILNENNIPVEAKLREETPATSLVEECMLAANKTVAEHAGKLSKKFRIKDVPFIYRIHDQPEPGQVADAISFIKTLGIRTKVKEPKAKDLNKLLKEVENSSRKSIVNQVLIRSMAKAIYSTKNPGHFGLGFKDYTHFTSPIRRYPDLIVHRLIKEYSVAKPDKNRIGFLKMLLKDTCTHSTETEKKAVEAERLSQRLAGTVLASSKIGKIFTGVISGVTNFGIFVLMDDLWVEGLLHIKDLKDDYYIYDEKKYTLTGKKKKRKFRFGDSITVQIVNTDIDRKKIELILAK